MSQLLRSSLSARGLTDHPSCQSVSYSLRLTEKVAGKGSGGRIFGGGVFFSLLFDGVDKVLTIVFGTTADSFEAGETRSRGGIGVDIDNLTALDILEKSHSSVACIVLHHISVVLAYAHIVGRVLEDAALTVGALGRVVKEVLAY